MAEDKNEVKAGGDGKERDPKPEKRAAGYYVADKKAVSTLDGIKDKGAKVTAEDFKGGKTTLDNLVKKGFVEVEK